MRYTMQKKDVIIELKDVLGLAKDKGAAVIEIEALLRYLTQIEEEEQEDITPSLEYQKLKFQSELAAYDAECKSRLELFKSVIEASKEALNAAMIINGGAVIAMLNFLGAILSKSGSTEVGLSLTAPLLWFGGGGWLWCISFWVSLSNTIFLWFK